MGLDFTRTREQPYDIQRVGIEALVKWDDPAVGRIYGGCFFLADEMGVGKTKQAIDAAQFLFDLGLINRVLVVAPAPVRAVWFDDELGELLKHGWLDIGHSLREFHARTRTWTMGADRSPRLEWLITNYEFIRSKARLQQLKSFCGPKTYLILDESSAVKTHSAQQTRASLELRRACGRVTLLNGTPIANHPGDMFSQGNIMDPRILDCKNWFHFRNRYAIMGGWQNKQIIGWRLLDDLQRRFKPYVLRRLTSDSLELPKKNAPVQIPAVLTERTWKLYREMRDEMVAWLDQTTMSVASQAGVKAMRLAQITSGFLGGIDALPVGLGLNIEDDELEGPLIVDGVVEIGREKLDVYLQWVYEELERNDWNHAILTWSRFRPEVHRTLRELAAKFPAASLGGR